MNNIQKIERALAFAKEVNLNDEQVKELMAMVLGLVNFKVFPTTPTPVVPWTPGWPNGGEIICSGPIGTTPPEGYQVYNGVVMQPQRHGTFAQFLAGEATSCDLPVGEIITGEIRFGGCACSPIGQPHSDNCKAMGINEGRPLQT